MTTINSSLPGSPECPPDNQVRPNNLGPAEREADHIPNLMRMAFSVRETAEILGVSDKTVRRLIDRKLLRASRALRHLLIPKKEIERFLQETSG
jgi:excisionase family DNA binding protein